MPAPLGKRTRMPAAHRPWIDPDPLQKGEKGKLRLNNGCDEYRETCLNCPLPKCPSALCPIPDMNGSKPKETYTGKPTGRPARPVPDDFAPRMDAGETVQSLCERYSVSKHTILKWKKLVKER